MDRVDLKAHLTAHIQEVARDRDPLFSPMGHLYVQTYIEGQLSQWGEVEREEFDYSGQSYCNLYLDLPAQTDARRLKAQTSEPTLFQRPLSQRPLFQRPAILIGAHYDAVHGSPGADDNATGVAALLELARSFAAVPAPYPIRLAAFDLEEYGRIGSLVSAQLAAEDGRALRLMISLEMLGYCTQVAHSQTYPAPLDRIYPSTGNFIALIGNLRTFPDLLAWQRRLKAGGTPCVILPIWNRGHPVPRTRDSDHSAFWDQGYNAIMVTDTANLRNPHYHRGSDRPGTLDLDFLTRLTQGLIDCLRNL
ncbi:MAG: M28 family peptidase [Synechococcales cyanobacterium CRU_2_2]|nr:M28 family peptidase [Synechococcales cyanobacterium CRU_2_2]